MGWMYEFPKRKIDYLRINYEWRRGGDSDKMMLHDSHYTLYDDECCLRRRGSHFWT